MKNLIFRKDKIVELCEDKSVLHLGFIQHTALYEKKIKNNDWLHKKIADVARELVGIDYLDEDVEKIKQRYGYECYCADVAKFGKFEIGGGFRKFDVVICGELIEHVDNPGLMLDGIKQFIHNDSILVITTPNPWYKYRIELIKSGKPEDKWLNREHVCWYSYQTLKQLLERKNYSEVTYEYYIGETEERFWGYSKWKKFIKKYLVKLGLSHSQKYLYDGLFFVAKYIRKE